MALECTLEMLPGQSTRDLGVFGGFLTAVIYGLIKCRQVEYDSYDVAMSQVYGMDSYTSTSFVNMELK